MAEAAKAKKPSFFKRIGKFFTDLISEMKKIVWPSKKQTWNNTVAVIVMVLICAVIIVGLDLIFGNLIFGKLLGLITG